MKEGTVVIIVAIGLMLSGFLINLATGLAQWANTDTGPGVVMWIIIMATCCANALNILVAFLSKKYANYVTNKTNGNGNAAVPDVPKQPTP
jgi:hypothetical protein